MLLNNDYNAYVKHHNIADTDRSLLFKSVLFFVYCVERMRGGDRGSGAPLQNYKNKGFLSNAASDSQKKTQSY